MGRRGGSGGGLDVGVVKLLVLNAKVEVLDNNKVYSECSCKSGIWK